MLYSFNYEETTQKFMNLGQKKSTNSGLEEVMELEDEDQDG